MKQKHTTTKKALQLQAAIYKLKTGKLEDIIKMGGLLLNVKENNQFKSMEPYFQRWGQYLTYSCISVPQAEQAIRAYQRIQELIGLVGKKKAAEYKALMVNMYLTNFNLLCQLPAVIIAALLEQGADKWAGDAIRAEIYKHTGRTPPKPRKSSSYDKEDAEELLFSLNNSPTRRGHKLRKRLLIARYEAIIEAL